MEHNEFTANGEQCLNCLSQPRGQPHNVARLVKDVESEKKIHEMLEEIFKTVEDQDG